MRRPVLYDRVRLGFMVFTLVWIGWYAQAQLSVVNVLAFLSALRTDFRWDYFLMAPLIFILWFATAASLLFWNRGAYLRLAVPVRRLAGTDEPARASCVKIPQLKIPFGVHQRLTALKYIVFLVLFGISLSALGDGRAGRGSGAVQDRDHPALRARLAVRAVRGRDDRVEPVRGTRLLPLPVSARRRAGDPGAAAAVRLAAPLPRVRQSLPALRQRVPGAGDPSGGAHQPERMHPVPALPDALPPRPANVR